MKKGCGTFIWLLVIFAIIVGVIGNATSEKNDSGYAPTPKITYKNPVVVYTPTPASVATPKATKKPAATPKPQATKKPAATPAVSSWDVCGTYRLSNNKIDAVVEIRDFEWLTEESFTVTYSYSFTSHISNDDLYNGPKMQQGVRYTGGPTTFFDDVALETKYVKINVDGLVDMYICGESINWDPIGPGTGVWIKVKGNYAQTYGEYWLYR